MTQDPDLGNADGKENRRTRSLSSGLVDLQNKLKSAPDFIFDVLIVGSGYGGSVAAQQLAGLMKTGRDGSAEKISVCVLERGSEYLPGMFPSSFGELPAHVRYGAQGTGSVTGRHEGLFDIHMGEDVSALVANGLGGGSLINAGVMLKPDFSSFKSMFPERVSRELESSYLDAARKLLVVDPLRVTTKPNTIQRSSLYSKDAYPLKYHRLAELGQRQLPELETEPAEIAVAMVDQPPGLHSVNLNACNGCGDCMTGCNVGAKASLDTNLLAQARRVGAEIFTGASVLSMSRSGPGHHPPGAYWFLEVVHTSPGLRVREEAPLKVKARKVILAAGALGSPEILLRSRSEKLLFSNTLGERFSCNGDNIAAVHKLEQAAHSTDDQHVALASRMVGPTITNMVKVPRQSDDKPGFWVQEFGIPSPLKRLFAELVTTGNSLAQLQTADDTVHGSESVGDTDPCAMDANAIERTLLVGLIGHDSAEGTLRLPVQSSHAGDASAQEGTLQIVWPQARHGKQITAAHEQLLAYCSKAFPEATVIANPMWRLLPTRLENLVSQPLGPVLTVHPLGGCPMGSDEIPGVVDGYGQVINPCSGAEDDWFGSLVVLDGSIIPGSLGANPSLTISALALRAVGYLRRAWAFGDVQEFALLAQRPISAPPQPQKTVLPESTQLEVIERLSGSVLLHVDEARPEPFVIELTLAYDQVDVSQLISSWGGRELVVNPEKSTIRLFQSRVWDEEILRVADDDQRELHAAWTAPLNGTLRFLHREPSSPFQRKLRALRAFLSNRGKRDIYQLAAESIDRLLHPEKQRPEQKKSGSVANFLALFADAWRMASRAGEVRRFDYALTVAPSTREIKDPLFSLFSGAMSGQVIRGEKRLTYDRRANPWKQLTTLAVTKLPLMPEGARPVLSLDTRFLVTRGLPLIRVAQQQNHVEALLDMASFGLYMTRVMIHIHLWTFRKPDTPAALAPVRLPGLIAGLPKPEVTEITVGLNARKGIDAVVRLTRYAKPDSKFAPVAMIHGYSVSGTTFTHPTLRPSAAEYFWHRGRDVWVIDLRTSAGMPTATVPWSFEEAALADIPAALLHIKNITGQRVDVIAHCIGAAMLGMALLTDARRIRNATIELGVDTWITPTQLGTLTAFNGMRTAATPHPTVRSIVLSQKGPLLRYTEANIFRAYLMRSLRRWLVPEGYQFRPPSDSRVADQLLDRLLASMPYPDDDYDMENPAWPWQSTPWTASRHRMDALYARDFSARNLAQDTLNAIDDLFGPINLDTVSQVIHFVQFSCITNQRGRGEFVTLDNLRERWGSIPTFAIHGAENGLADVSTQTLLEKNFVAAGVPFKRKTYPGLGHQDVWIGTSSEQVFGDIEVFMRELCPDLVGAATPCVPVLKHATPAQWQFEMPWIGPRIHRDDSTVGIYALSSPRFGNARLVLVPVNVWVSDIPAVRCADILTSEIGDSRNWMHVLQSREWAGENDSVKGWLALVAYARDQVTLNESGSLPVTGALSNADTANDVAALGVAIDHWLENASVNLGDCFIDRRNIDRHRYVCPLTFTFVLGSCQYSPGLLDKVPAKASLESMAGNIDSDGLMNAEFAIFAGDQIYADATAGLVDPTRSDERFDLPYELAFRVKPMRRIMRSIPTFMMLDDHEIVDNWEHPHPANKAHAKHAKRLWQQGLKAYWKYQRMDDRRAQGSGKYSDSASFSFEHGCAAFYMLDTRSQRQYRKPGEPDAARMFSDGEMSRLQGWLLQNKSLVKFIVSPSILLPRRLDALNQGVDYASRSDSWEGYPSDRRELLEFIVNHQIQNVVFLSGDEHLSCLANATLQSGPAGKEKAAVQIASIHASGLYAPFPFANSRAEDFVQGHDNFKIGSLHCSATAQFAPAGGAYASVSVARDGERPVVSVEFRLARGYARSTDIFGNAPLQWSASHAAGDEMPKVAAR